MNKAQFIERIAQFLELSRGELAIETDLRSLESWDSLAVLNLIAFFDSEFGFSVSFAEIDGCRTIADLIGLSKGRISD
jgi:acyl carrier protein